MNKTVFWPGTNIRKSTGNAFDLSSCGGALAVMAARVEQKAQAGLKGAKAQQAKRNEQPPQKYE